MGIDGQRLDEYQMAARKYTLSSTKSHIVIDLPIGTPDGYYKVGQCTPLIQPIDFASHSFAFTALQSLAPDGQYHITFTVEPMLELVWREESTQTDTKYKVLFPITTPLMSWPTQFTGSESESLIILNVGFLFMTSTCTFKILFDTFQMQFLRRGYLKSSWVLFSLMWSWSTSPSTLGSFLWQSATRKGSMLKSRDFQMAQSLSTWKCPSLRMQSLCTYGQVVWS